MAEELALQQRVRDRGAVDRDEGAPGPAREAMDRAREELLARAALPFEQHGGIGRSHAARLVLHGLQGRGIPHDRRDQPRALLGEEERLATARPALDRARDQDAQELRVHRLRDEVLGAALHRVHRGLDRAEGRHHDHGHGRVDGARRVQDRQAVGARQPPVRQHEVDALPRPQPLDRGRAAGDARDGPPLAPEHLLEHGPQGLLVLDDQDGCHGGERKSGIGNRETKEALLFPAAG